MQLFFIHFTIIDSLNDNFLRKSLAKLYHDFFLLYFLTSHHSFETKSW